MGLSLGRTTRLDVWLMQSDLNRILGSVKRIQFTVTGQMGSLAHRDLQGEHEKAVHDGVSSVRFDEVDRL
jgi:hypothetical protein